VLGREYAVTGLDYAVVECEYAAFLWMQVSVKRILDSIRSHLALQASHLALWRLGRSWAAEQQCHAELQAFKFGDTRAQPRDGIGAHCSV
jgi:hypothetical protein